MMESRLGWLVIGLVAGAVLGYLARIFQERQEEEDDMSEGITNDREGGYSTPEWLNNVALLLVVALVAYASFTSQSSSHKSDRTSDRLADTQQQLVQSNACNQVYTGKVIAALNARTEFSAEQNNAIVALQKAQAVFLGGLLKPGPAQQGLDRAAVTQYFKALTTYTTVAGKSSKQVAENPYPTAKDFTDCLKGK